MFFSKPIVNTISTDDAKQELGKDLSIVLIDVRSESEYAQVHIPRSINIPLANVKTINQIVPDHSARLFVYCLSGSRSQSACNAFAKMGYTNITNIGGISKWHGETEKG